MITQVNEPSVTNGIYVSYLGKQLSGKIRQLYVSSIYCRSTFNDSRAIAGLEKIVGGINASSPIEPNTP